MTEDKREKFRVVGAVQNIGYRHWAATAASRLAIRGWIKNESDGSVTALLIGESAAVEEMAGALRQGPPQARVLESIALALDGDDLQFSGGQFEIRQ